MTVAEIYDHFSLPQNLRQHMLRVGAVGQLIVDSFRQPNFDQEIVVKTLLLHDLGNLIKFKFDQPDMFDPADRDQLPHLQALQTQMQKLYGQTADEATPKMMAEIGADPRIIELCVTSHGEQLADFLPSDRWDRKIAFYCDMRVGPFGILSLDDRFADLKVRYDYNREKIEQYHQLSQDLEQQLQTATSIDIQAITDETVNTLFSTLLFIEV